MIDCHDAVPGDLGSLRISVADPEPPRSDIFFLWSQIINFDLASAATVKRCFFFNVMQADPDLH